MNESLEPGGAAARLVPDRGAGPGGCAAFSPPGAASGAPLWGVLGAGCPEPALADLRRIEASLAGSLLPDAETFTVGPFRAWLATDTDRVWLNYAMPIAPGPADLNESLADLRRLFDQRHRTLRFEFAGELWPDLPAALEQAGLRLQERQPLMRCTAADFRPCPSPEVGVRFLTAADDREELATYLTVQSHGFGEDSLAITTAALGRLRRQLGGGNLRAALARLGGVPAGVAAVSLQGDLGELVGVATAPAWRRRGVASTVTGVLLQDYFARGHDRIWLSAADAVAQAVYARLGFQTIGVWLNYIAASER